MFSFAWWAWNQKWEIKMANWLFLSYTKNPSDNITGGYSSIQAGVQWYPGCSQPQTMFGLITDHLPLFFDLHCYAVLLVSIVASYFLVPSFSMFIYSFTFRRIAFFPISILLFFFSIAYEFMLTSIKESLCSLTFTTFSFNLFSAHLEAYTVTPYLSSIIEEYLIFHK